MAREYLKAERKRLGYTQRLMASLLDISERQYQRIELGATRGTIDLWDRLEDITGVNQRTLRIISSDQANRQEGHNE